MNNRYKFSFLTGIINLFSMALPNGDEVSRQCFKSGLSFNEIFPLLSAHHNISLSIPRLKRIFKIWVYREECQRA